MKPYLNKIEAIIDLHERGFTEDFELFGNDLFWVQKKMFLRPKNYQIIEVHRFLELSGNKSVIFCVIANRYCTKGILLNHFKSYTATTPPVIHKKLLHLDSNYYKQQYDYVDVTFSV